jgi:hypothetical protein
MNDYDEKTLQVDLDKQTIAQLSLEWGILNKNIPDYNLIKDTNNIIISTQNINKNYNFSNGKISFIILTPEKIQQKSNIESDFLFIKFYMLEINGNNAIVELNNNWALSEETRENRLGLLSGGGAKIPFKKEGGRWLRQNVTEIWMA